MWQDLRFACRILGKSPGFTVIVALTLALGIGANTAVFSVIDGTLLRPLRYRDPDRLVDVINASTKNPQLSKTFGTYSDFEEYSTHARTLEKTAFVSWATGGATLTGRGPARNILTIPVSEDFFSMLGVNAILGRAFERGDANRGCSVVLSNGFWRETMAGAPEIIGATLNLNDRACTVRGVMPPGFEFYPRKTQLWMLAPDDPRPHDRFLGITFARLKPGVTAAQAQAELAALYKQIHKSDWQRDFTPTVNGLQNEFTFLAGRNVRSTLYLLLGAVALVLLIACVNVANLLLGRAWARRREFGIRAALGSSRARLIRQVLIEAIVLAAMGGAAGTFLAFTLVRYFVYANPVELPVGSDLTISLPVLGFTALLTIATSIAFGMMPAWSSSRAGDLKRNAGANRRLNQALVAAEISLSPMLLAGAGLLIQSVLRMKTAPLGFNPDHVAVMSMNLPEKRYSGKEERLRFNAALLRNLAAAPGVEAAAIATSMPPYGAGNYEMQTEGRPRTSIQDVGQNAVSADYFRVLRIALRRGRVFDRRDTAASESVAVVNAALVREYFPALNPIGQRVRMIGFTAEPWVTIVGVVATEKHSEFMHEMSWLEQPALYRLIEQDPPGFLSIAVRTRGDRDDGGRAIQRAVTETDKDVPVGESATVVSLLGGFMKYARFRAVVLGVFAGLALLLAAIGLYGLLSQYVVQRTQELGLRMAVGARPRDILRLITVQAGKPVVVGVVIGMVLLIGLTRYISSLLFDVAPLDTVTMIGAPTSMIAVALLAIWKPARDAASVDPMTALRHE